MSCISQFIFSSNFLLSIARVCACVCVCVYVCMCVCVCISQVMLGLKLLVGHTAYIHMASRYVYMYASSPPPSALMPPIHVIILSI